MRSFNCETLQNLMVDENIIKLEVKKLREILFTHADEVLTLEQRQLRLQTVSFSSHVRMIFHVGPYI